MGPSQADVEAVFGPQVSDAEAERIYHAPLPFTAPSQEAPSTWESAARHNAQRAFDRGLTDAPTAAAWKAFQRQRRASLRPQYEPMEVRQRMVTQRAQGRKPSVTQAKQELARDRLMAKMGAGKELTDADWVSMGVTDNPAKRRQEMTMKLKEINAENERAELQSKAIVKSQLIKAGADEKTAEIAAKATLEAQREQNKVERELRTLEVDAQTKMAQDKLMNDLHLARLEKDLGEYSTVIEAHVKSGEPLPDYILGKMRDYLTLREGSEQATAPFAEPRPTHPMRRR
jgi:hypothetical protein